MYNNERFYIQAKYQTNKFLRNLSFHTPLNYTFIDSYTPNISNYPLSFSSLKSIQDYFFNTLVAEYSSPLHEISYGFISELEGLKIVKMGEYECSNNMQFLPECDNTYLNNMAEYCRKATFKFLSYRIFNSRVTDFYIEKTGLEQRNLGIGTSSNNYIVDEINYSTGGISYSNFCETQNKLSNIGANYSSDYKQQLISFSTLEDLNFARISIDQSQNWKITREEEIASLENKFSTTAPYYLN